MKEFCKSCFVFVFAVGINPRYDIIVVTTTI